METYDARFKFPFTCIIAGGSGSGKTTLCSKILRLKDELFTNESCKNVIFFFKTWQPIYNELDQDGIVTQWFQKCPSSDDIRDLAAPFQEKGGTICVIDDFMNEISKDMVEIFTVISHHSRVNIILLLQNIFPKNVYSRDLSLNAKYIIVHKNPRENAQIKHLARQIAPGEAGYIIDAFHETTREPYSYLLFDLHQETPDNIRVRSNILPEEFPMKVYVSK